MSITYEKCSNQDLVQRVAKDLGISQIVAKKIIQAYQEDIHTNLLQGKSVTIPCIVTLKIESLGDKLCVHSKVSSQLRKELKERNIKKSANKLKEEEIC